MPYSVRMADLTEDQARTLRGLQRDVERGQAARTKRDDLLVEHRRDAVPVTHLAEAVGLTRQSVHEILRKRGVRPGEVTPPGRAPERAEPYRVRAALRALGFDVEGSPDQLATAIRDRLARESAPDN